MSDEMLKAYALMDLLYPGFRSCKSKYDKNIEADLACDELGDIWLVLATPSGKEARTRLTTALFSDEEKNLLLTKMNTAFCVFEQCM